MLRWCLDSFFSWVRCGHLLQSSENNWRSILTWTWYRHVKSQEWYPEACLNYVKLPARSLNYGYIFIYNMFLCKFLSINETLYIYNIEREKKGVCIYIYVGNHVFYVSNTVLKKKNGLLKMLQRWYITHHFPGPPGLRRIPRTSSRHRCSRGPGDRWNWRVEKTMVNRFLWCETSWWTDSFFLSFQDFSHSSRIPSFISQL